MALDPDGKRLGEASGDGKDPRRSRPEASSFEDLSSRPPTVPLRSGSSTREVQPNPPHPDRLPVFKDQVQSVMNKDSSTRPGAVATTTSNRRGPAQHQGRDRLPSFKDQVASSAAGEPNEEADVGGRPVRSQNSAAVASQPRTSSNSNPGRGPSFPDHQVARPGMKATTSQSDETPEATADVRSSDPGAEKVPFGPAYKDQHRPSTQAAAADDRRPSRSAGRAPPVGLLPRFKDQARGANGSQEDQQQQQSQSQHSTAPTTPDQSQHVDGDSAPTTAGGGDGGDGHGRRLIEAQLVQSTVETAEPVTGAVILRRRSILLALGLLMGAAATVGGVCGATGKCSASSSRPVSDVQGPVAKTTPAPSTSSSTEPTVPPSVAPSNAPSSTPSIASIKVETLSFIEGVRFSSNDISYPAPRDGSATPEELAVDWLLDDEEGGGLLLDLLPSNSNSTTRLVQRYALAAFYFSTGGSSSWVDPNGWLVAEDECTWNGIVCSADSSVVTVNLNGNNLAGSIPLDFALIDSIQVLSLNNNRGLEGPLPTSFANLNNLQELDLGQCGLSGSLPATVGQLSSLTRVVLTDNEFTGPLPLSTAWTSLTHFEISDNSFTGPLISESVGALSSLQVFEVSNNQISGFLPDSISNWSNLISFLANSNLLTSTIPSTVGSWTQLFDFQVEDNFLRGTLPEGVGSWNLARFQINGNKFSGSLPDSVGNWEGLTIFSAGFPDKALENRNDNNLLTGSIPESVGLWKNLRIFIAAQNQFSGSLPSSVGNWTALTQFIIPGNNLSGPLPDTIGNWGSLNVFSVGSNRLTSSLPESIGNWRNLDIFEIGGEEAIQTNDFSGSLPSTIGAWSKLRAFSAYNNSLTGSLPEAIAAWTSLSLGFDCSLNLLQGTIPASIGPAWSNIEAVLLHSNPLLTGAIPESVSNWRSLEQATFNDTSLSGSVPSGICDVSGLRVLAADCNTEILCDCCTACY